MINSLGKVEGDIFFQFKGIWTKIENIDFDWLLRTRVLHFKNWIQDTEENIILFVEQDLS